MDLSELKWDEKGLLPVVVADANSGEVLTLAYANREALERTLAEQSTYLFSRSRNALWHKGETSGNTQQVVSVAYDCDADALLYRVIPNGPACHTGARSCFHRVILTVGKDREGTLSAEARSAEVLSERSERRRPRATARGSFDRAISHLEQLVEERKRGAPEGSYTAKLYAGGIDRIGKKIGEEATEVVIAAKNGAKDEIVRESADLIYHWIVLLRHMNVSLEDVGQELLRRAK